MRRPDTPRDARRKLLLLEAQMYRLELMQARQQLRSAARGRALSVSLPAMLASLLRHRASGLLATALPLLLRGGAIGRWSRRALLLAGSGVAAFTLFGRRRQRSAGAATDIDSAAAPAAGKKNPGRSRD